MSNRRLGSIPARRGHWGAGPCRVQAPGAPRSKRQVQRSFRPVRPAPDREPRRPQGCRRRVGCRARAPSRDMAGISTWFLMYKTIRRGGAAHPGADAGPGQYHRGRGPAGCQPLLPLPPGPCRPGSRPAPRHGPLLRPGRTGTAGADLSPVRRRPGRTSEEPGPLRPVPGRAAGSPNSLQTARGCGQSCWYRSQPQVEPAAASRGEKDTEPGVSGGDRVWAAGGDPRSRSGPPGRSLRQCGGRHRPEGRE